MKLAWSRFFWLVQTSAVIAAFLAPFIISTHATAAIVESSVDFDHNATGFPLNGRHQLLTCESCHLNGVFKGLPKQCSGCHDGSFARGKHPAHVQTVEQCDVCHTPRGFGLSAIMDHTTTTALCITCHNGTQSTGKSVGHIPSTNNCGACHVTVAWSPVSTVDHEELNDAQCRTCHNGRDARGKSPGHIPVLEDRCDACHNTVSFRPVVGVDHSIVVGSCGVSGCHTKPAIHLATTNRCEACHLVAAWSPWLLGVVDNDANREQTHREILGGTCNECHGGNPVPVASIVGVAAVGQPADHIPTSASCDLCHTITAWTPSTFTHAVIDTSRCVTCHLNSSPSTIRATSKPATHIDSTVECGSCHISTGPGLSAWFRPNIRMDHSQTNLATQRCDSCHTPGRFTAKGLNHVPTTEDCGLCHSTAKWVPAAVDHTNIVDNCISCHNGTDASGQAGKHLQGLTTSTVCQACHNKFPRVWGDTLAFDHTQTPITTCQTCHNGTLARGKIQTHATTSDLCASCHVNTQWKPVTQVDHAQATGPCLQCHNGAVANADGKPTTHPTTSDLCGSCHVAETPWTPVINLDHAQATGPCLQCHNGAVANADAKPAAHPTTTDLCGSCHVADTPWLPIAKVDHTQATGPCVQCHDGTVANARAKSLGHPSTTNVCEGCHNSTAWKPLLAKIDHTQVTGLCGECHNGVIATGKNQGHIVTTIDCDLCHTTTAWKPAAIDHTPITANCISCHNGVDASGKGGKHSTGLNTSNLCENCHNKFPQRWIDVRTVDHAQVIGTCVSCHNGVLAEGKGGKHLIGLITTDDCGACHDTAPAAFRPIRTFDHNQGNPAGTCVSCHNGTLGAPKSATHPPTSDNCTACHSQITWNPVLRVDHNEVRGASCADAACHLNDLPATHIPIATPFLCDACHMVAPATWLQIRIVDHTQVLGACVTCHNGVQAAGKSGAHNLGMVTSDACEFCHNIPPLTFNPAKRPFDHSQTTAACVSCHNNTLFVGKGPSHLTTTDDCAGCHNTVAWAQATTNHQFVLGTCESCHNGSTAGAAKPASHCTYPATQDCNTCHLIPPSSWANTIADCPAVATPPPAPAPAPPGGGGGGAPAPAPAPPAPAPAPAPGHGGGGHGGGTGGM